MVRRVTVQTLCSHCIKTGKEIDAHSIKFKLNGVPLEVDLCDGCDDLFIGPLRDMAQRDRGEATAPMATGTLSPRVATEQLMLCIDTTCKYSTTSHGAWAQHIRQRHAKGIGFVQLIPRCPLCGVTFTDGALPGLHVKDHDGIPNLGYAITTAIRQGDQHGVMAQIQEILRPRAGTVPTPRDVAFTAPREPAPVS